MLLTTAVGFVCLFLFTPSYFLVPQLSAQGIPPSNPGPTLEEGEGPPSRRARPPFLPGQRGRGLGRPGGGRLGRPGGGRLGRPGGRSRPRAAPPSQPNPAFNAIKQNRPDFSEANAEDITNENYPELLKSMDFANVDIAELIKPMSEMTGKNFIIGPGVQGKITIISPTQVTVAEAYQAFLASLAIHKLTIVPSGRFLKIQPINEVPQGELFSGPYTPDSDQYITRVVQLEYVQSNEIMQQLNQLVTPGIGKIRAYAPTNTLIISDLGSNVTRLLEIIEGMDVDTYNQQREVIKIEHADVKEFSELIKQVIDEPNTSGSSRSRNRRSRLRGNNQGSPISHRVIPDERTNSLIVVGSRAGIDRIKQLVRQLDFELTEPRSGKYHVYRVKHSKAENLQKALTGATGAASGANTSTQRRNRPGQPRGSARANSTQPSSGSLLGGEVSITAYEDTNSLIFVASAQDYEIISGLLAQLDVRRDQVLVEAVIMDLAVSNTFSSQLSLLKMDDKSGGIGRVGAVSDSLSLASLINPLTPGLVLGFGAGEDVKVKIPQGAGVIEETVKDLMGFFQLLSSLTETNVLATPNVIAMDNIESHIEISHEVPIGVGTTTAGSTGQSIATEPRYKTITTDLKITPYISPDKKSVRMSVEQNSGSVGASVTLNDGTPGESTATTTTKRTIKTDVIVNNKDTIILGGLMSDEDSKVEKKTPILGDIPILGWLFRSSSTTPRKSNLMVFLTPHIIGNQADAREASDEKMRERLDFIKRNMKGKDPHGYKMDQLRANNSSALVETLGEEENILDDIEEPILEENSGTEESTEIIEPEEFIDMENTEEPLDLSEFDTDTEIIDPNEAPPDSDE